MKRATPACRLLLFSLRRKYVYFRRNNKLSEDGSFYYDDKRLAEELGLHKKTIARAKKHLSDIGGIKFKAGRFKGSATKYWIPAKDVFLPSSGYPTKGNSFPAKDGNLFLKASPNATPNKETNKETNGEDNFSLDELRKGILGLVKVRGKDWARQFYINKGFEQELIDKLLAEEE